MRIEKVTLIGMGAMGTFFAPKLQKIYGDNFRVLANGDRGSRLKNNGIYVGGDRYDFNIIDSDNRDTADLIIIATKDMGIASAIEDIKHQVGENTLIMCAINGVESEEKVAAVYGWEHVLYTVMRVSIVMKEGHSNYDGKSGVVLFGERDNRVKSENVLAIEEVFKQADIPYQIEEDMVFAMWFKYMANVGENMTCAMLGIPFGAFRDNDYANFIRVKAMEEVAIIANLKGIMLTRAEIEKQSETIKHLPKDNKPSTVQDIENHRKTEVEMFSGAICKMGKQLNVKTPVNEILYNGIKVLEGKYID